MLDPSGAVGGNAQNEPTVQTPNTRSTFDLKYHFFDTHRFGEYHPHYVEEGVKGDSLPIRSSHNVMSYTLKAPLMQSIDLYKDYFLVPMEAILPNNWEKVFDNPVRGDDVPADAGCYVENFWSVVESLMSAYKTSFDSIIAAGATTDAQALAAVLKYLCIGEMFYSNGSLLSSLGCHGAPYVTISKTISAINYKRYWDDFVDDIFSAIITGGGNSFSFVLNVDGFSYTVRKNPESNAYTNDISFRHALSLVRDNPVFTIGTVSTGSPVKTSVASVTSVYNFSFMNAAVGLDLSRLMAYQIVCAHYYSNDHIDYVYSAELFRQLIKHYHLRLISQNLGNTAFNNLFFTRNGTRYEYDSLSAHWFSYWVTRLTASGVPDTILANSTSDVRIYGLAYLSAIFSYRRSLRYQDYFTGSRAQPLAVGSTGVTVSGGSVDVVDITRNIQRQRFLNAVNRVRHSFEGYLKGIFGGETPAPDYHNPFFLASTKDEIFGQQTENTGAAQMTNELSITSNLRSNGSRYMIEIRCDRPCVLIGISHYDLARVYCRSTERMMFHADRFDMFNPFMQFIGDQPITIQELGLNVSNGIQYVSNFAYTLRHMEYKQRFNQCAGGFVDKLPGFAFLADDSRGDQSSINPDWIRSVPSELDRFYLSLTGYSLGSYFHFIVDNYNDCTGSRPMAYAPSIL